MYLSYFVQCLEYFSSVSGAYLYSAYCHVSHVLYNPSFDNGVVAFLDQDGVACEA